MAVSSEMLLMIERNKGRDGEAKKQSRTRGASLCGESSPLPSPQCPGVSWKERLHDSEKGPSFGLRAELSS